METKTTNFLTEQSKVLINNLIHTLHSLKDDQFNASDVVIVTKQLNNLVSELNASLYSKDNVAQGSRISVLLPNAYPSVKESLSTNLLTTSPIESLEKNEVVEKEPTIKIKEVVVSEKAPEVVEDEDATQILSEEKEIVPEETPDVVVVAPPTKKEEAPIEETESVVVALPKEEVSEIIDEPQPDEVIAEKEEIVVPSETSKKEEKEPEAGNYFSLWETFASNDVPTLLHQDGVEPEKVEDKSSNKTSELTPIKDLKKSISINDRYLFINELFRGDESTYERSIKTINGFNIYQEASFWIERELKVKLGWEEKDPTVKDFMELVKRRFL